VGELGVGGEKADQNMIDFRAAQAKIATRPELKGSVGDVRTAPSGIPSWMNCPGKWNLQNIG